MKFWENGPLLGQGANVNYLSLSADTIASRTETPTFISGFCTGFLLQFCWQILISYYLHMILNICLNGFTRLDDLKDKANIICNICN